MEWVGRGENQEWTVTGMKYSEFDARVLEGSFIFIMIKAFPSNLFFFYWGMPELF